MAIGLDACDAREHSGPPGQVEPDSDEVRVPGTKRGPRTARPSIRTRRRPAPSAYRFGRVACARTASAARTACGRTASNAAA